MRTELTAVPHASLSEKPKKPRWVKGKLHCLPLWSHKGMSQLGAQSMRQVQNAFGLGHLRSLRATLVPGAGTKTNTRLTGPQGPLCGVTLDSHYRRDALMIMRTDLTAVPHAGLGYHFLRVQVGTNGSWGLQTEKGPKAQDRKRRAGRDDVVRSCLPSALALYGN